MESISETWIQKCHETGSGYSGIPYSDAGRRFRVIESVFSYPGIGLTMTNAIVSGDYPVVLVTTLIIAAAMLICSFMVDVLNALLDPRVRLGE